MRSSQILSFLGSVMVRVMAINGYTKLSKALELVPHHQMEFCDLPRTALCKGNHQRFLSSSDRDRTCVFDLHLHSTQLLWFFNRDHYHITTNKSGKYYIINSKQFPWINYSNQAERDSDLQYYIQIHFYSS